MILVKSFEELSIPLVVISTDLMQGREIAIKSGDLHSAIRSSMSVPGVFSPVARDGHILVDGGLVNPISVNACRDLGADRVIAVDLNSMDDSEKEVDFAKLNIFSVVDETFRVVMNIASARSFASPPGILLQPPLGEISFPDFHKANEIVRIGYEYTMDRQKELIGMS